MKSIPESHPAVKVIYYTYPECNVSWKMQPHWERLLSTFGQNLSLKFCLPALVPDGSGPVSSGNTHSILTTGIGVKAASFQSQWAADEFVTELRRAAMVEERDTTSKEVLFDVALRTSRADHRMFDYNRFCDDFYNVATRRALEDDFHKIRVNAIDAFPAITFTVGGRGLKVKGYASYQQLLEIVKQLLHTAASPASGII